VTNARRRSRPVHTRSQIHPESPFSARRGTLGVRVRPVEMECWSVARGSLYLALATGGGEARAGVVTRARASVAESPTPVRRGRTCNRSSYSNVAATSPSGACARPNHPCEAEAGSADSDNEIHQPRAISGPVLLAQDSEIAERVPVIACRGCPATSAAGSFGERGQTTG